MVTVFRATQITLVTRDSGLQGDQGDEGIRATKLSQAIMASTGTQLLLLTIENDSPKNNDYDDLHELDFLPPDQDHNYILE